MRATGHPCAKMRRRLTEGKVREGMAELRCYLDNELPAVLEEAQVGELEAVDNTDTLIESPMR